MAHDPPIPDLADFEHQASVYIKVVISMRLVGGGSHTPALVPARTQSLCLPHLGSLSFWAVSSWEFKSSIKGVTFCQRPSSPCSPLRACTSSW